MLTIIYDNLRPVQTGITPAGGRRQAAGEHDGRRTDRAGSTMAEKVHRRAALWCDVRSEDGREGPLEHASQITRSYDAKNEATTRRTKLGSEERSWDAENEAGIRRTKLGCEERSYDEKNEAGMRRTKLGCGERSYDEKNETGMRRTKLGYEERS